MYIEIYDVRKKFLIGLQNTSGIFEFVNPATGMKGFADNYTGNGDLTDKSLEIVKRARPTF